MATDIISIVLRQPDFTTAVNIATAINTKLNDSIASAIDASEIVVKVPASRQPKLAAFLAELEAIEAKTDAVAKVVLNERTGTVVAGSMVRILPVTISHGAIGPWDPPGSKYLKEALNIKPIHLAYREIAAKSTALSVHLQLVETSASDAHQ